MTINIREALGAFIASCYADRGGEFLPYIPDIRINPETIRALMINEVVPHNPADNFYSSDMSSSWAAGVTALFREAEIPAHSPADILNMGIYITNAVKLPKSESAIETAAVAYYLPILEEELRLFPSVKVIMLMGDVAKKAFNMIAKKNTGRNAVPSAPTYKIRKTELFYKNMRILPSYIMTGKNILIEKSKFTMAAEDVSVMAGILKASL